MSNVKAVFFLLFLLFLPVAGAGESYGNIDIIFLNPTTTTSTTPTTTTSTTTTILSAESTVNIEANITKDVDLNTQVNTTFSIITNETIASVNITVNKSDTTPTSSSINATSIKYIQIENSTNLNETYLKWVIIKMYYAESELSDRNATESSLKLVWWNASVPEWQNVSSTWDWVYDNGLNAANNYVWANASHFSYYALGGEDLDAPSISGGSPTGTTSDSTPTISVTTNEDATCEYKSSDFAYGSGTQFTATGGRTHSSTLSEIGDGSYTYYARCMDKKGNKNVASYTWSFTVSTRTAGAGAGGGGAVTTTAVTLPTPAVILPTPTDIQFISQKVLNEVLPGEDVSFRIKIKNLKSSALSNLSISVSGIPESWFTVDPDSLSLGPEEMEEFDVSINIPPSASPKDYRVDVKVSNGKTTAESFFILRIKDYPPDYDKPIIQRSVFIDSVKKETNVEIDINNPVRNFTLVQVVENIPKTIAFSTNDVTFETRPTKIVRTDPVVQWDLSDLEAGEKRTISYSVSKVPSLLSKILYWPLEQLNIFTMTMPKELGLVDLQIPSLYKGGKSTLHLIINNPEDTSQIFNVTFDLPTGWNMEPRKIEGIIKGSDREAFDLQLSVPSDAEADQMLRMTFNFDESTIIKEYSLSAKEYQITEWLVYGIAILGVAAGVYIVVKLVRKRRRSYGIREGNWRKLMSIKKVVMSGQY